MEIGGRTVLVCSCEGTIPLDTGALAKLRGAGAVRFASRLCTAEIDRFVDAAGAGEPVVVACTQEEARFERVRQACGSAAAVNYVNIRESAGWSSEAASAQPKIAALLAEGTLDPPSVTMLTSQSQGRTLVYGGDRRAIELAAKLPKGLEPIVLLTGSARVLPPAQMDFPVFAGTIVRAEGHLGAFTVTIDGLAAALPSGRRALLFGPPRAGERLGVDLILDLSGGMPLFAAPNRRDGYARVDPDDPLALARAMAVLGERVGTQERPLYLDYRPGLCVHARGGRSGCSSCIDDCPAGALEAAGDGVTYDPFVCAGCGTCAAICPTGAIAYAVPPPEHLHLRLATLLGVYHEAGGSDAVLLVHDREGGRDLIDLLARRGHGLPARVIPFRVTPLTQLGLDFFLAAFARGAAAVRVLVGESGQEELGPLHRQLGLVDAVMHGLGYGRQRAAVIEAASPDQLAEGLASLPPMRGAAPASLPPFVEKRDILHAALGHLHDGAPAPADVLELPERAPFGAIAVDTAGCSQCFECASVCPTGALYGAVEPSALLFTERDCIQCGLCQGVCARQSITLQPRYDFRAVAGRRRLVVPAAAEGR